MNTRSSPKHFRPIRARVDLDALRHNLRLTRQWAGESVSLLCAVKANAYGHGAVTVARLFEAEGVASLGVASPEEGIELREAGIRLPILLFGGPFSAGGDLLAEYRLTPVIYHAGQIEFLDATSKVTLPVQLKVDTGMTRLGVFPEEIGEVLKSLARARHLQLQGVLTHLACADTEADGATARQYRRFLDVQSALHRWLPQVEIFHLANSAAILQGQLGDCRWARPGLILYGANPHLYFEKAQALKPVMHFETEVISLKTVPAGTAVSYGGEWVASRTSRIAVIAVGYADGYLRRLGGLAQVGWNRQRLPVVGRVCMDLTMIDATEAEGMAIGDEVRLWGEGLKVEEVAAWAGTLAYELFCAVSARVPRIYTGASNHGPG